MAIRVRQIEIPPVSRVNRVVRSIPLTEGAQVLGVYQAGPGSAFIVVRGDLQAAPAPRDFSAVKAGVNLAAEEIAGVYIGSFSTYWIEDGPEIFHLFQLDEVP